MNWGEKIRGKGIKRKGKGERNKASGCVYVEKRKEETRLKSIFHGCVGVCVGVYVEESKFIKHDARTRALSIAPSLPAAAYYAHTHTHTHKYRRKRGDNTSFRHPVLIHTRKQA